MTSISNLRDKWIEQGRKTERAAIVSFLEAAIIGKTLMEAILLSNLEDAILKGKHLEGEQ